MYSKLAINGGKAVRSKMLNYARQSIDQSDLCAVDSVLKSGWLTTGPAVGAFEKSISDYTGALNVIALNTGTAALHAAVYAAGVNKGDEVLVPSISFVASSNCILYQGGIPVFCDLSPDTLNIEPIEIEKKITPKTRAIVVVDFAGHPCDHGLIKEIAETYNVPVIEDAAHSLGATYMGKKVGLLNNLTTLSFHPVKHITTGEGGAVLTNDYELAKMIRSFRHHGIDLDLHERGRKNSWEYDVLSLGYNYRIPDINCALGLSQMEKLEGWLERRRQIANMYSSLLRNNPMLQLPQEKPGCKSSWHLYVVRLNLDRICATRAEVFNALRAENIGVNVHYIPIPWMSYYKGLGYKKGDWPIAEREYERILTIPLFPLMTNGDVEDVAEALWKVWKAYER